MSRLTVTALVIALVALLALVARTADQEFKKEDACVEAGGLFLARGSICIKQECLIK